MDRVQAKAAIVLRLKQVQAGHLGDVKSVGGGLSELRWHMGPGYRVYFCKSGDQIILLLSAIGDVAKARGMAQIARDTGLGRESLYKAFAAGAKPRFDTVLKVLRVLGVEMHAYPQAH